jgi:hypothetical protein
VIREPETSVMERGGSNPFEPEEERFDLRRLGRAALWALAAVVAVMTVAAAAQSETGARRMAVAFNTLPTAWRPAAQMPPNAEPQLARAAPADADARRLADAVKLLSADRDRLLARLEALERNLDVTGAIPAQPATPRAPPAPTDPAAAKESPPVGRAAQVPPAQDIAAESVATKTEFGVDLGGDSTLEGLRTLWSTLKAQHGAALDGLRPLIAVREGGKAGTVELRLIAGPLANAATAARLCAALTTALAPCQPATFDGQRLALR